MRNRFKLDFVKDSGATCFRQVVKLTWLINLSSTELMLSKNDLSLSFSVVCGCHFFMHLSVRFCSVLIAFTVVLCSGFTQVGKVSLEVI